LSAEIAEIEDAPHVTSAVGDFFARSRAFSSFQHRDYRYFWTGNVAAFTAMAMQQVAQGWLIFSLTNSAFLLGLVSFMGTLPIFVFSLVGGAVADRMEKRRLIHVTQTINMVCILALAILTSTDLIEVWHVFITAFLSGSAMAFNAPARQAFVVELVGRRNLMNAIALNSSGMNITRMFGPALGGVLVSAIGVDGTFYINAACYAIAIATLIPMQITGKPLAQNRSVWNNLVEGLRYVRQNDTILALMGLVAVPTIFGMCYQMLMPVFAGEVLNVGAGGLGVLMGVNGAGALVGSLALAFVGDYEKRGKVLISAAVGFSTAVILFSLSTGVLPASFVLALAVIMVVGGTNVVFMATTNTLLQTMSPDELRGRVMSVFMLTWGLMPLGTLPAGAIASSLGAPFAVGLGGLICLVFVLLLTARQPKLWHLS